MGKPLMLQEADAERIETLKKRLDAKRKEGYTLVGYVTKVLREALGGRAA